MEFFMNVFYKIIVGSTLCIAHMVFPNTVGVACVENKDKDHKVVIIYDQHDESKTVTSTNHQNDLKKLISALSKHTKKSTYYIEYPHKTEHFKGTYDFSTIHVPVKDAIAHNMNNGSIEYKPFDQRSDEDFLVHDMILNTDRVHHAITNNYPLPKQFKQLSLDSYLKSINKSKARSENLAKELPDELVPCHERNNIYNETKNIINRACEILKIDKKAHFFELAKKISNQGKAQFILYTTLVDMQSVESDLSLLKSIINDTNKISVVSAGAFHAHNLEQALSRIGYKNVFADRNLKKGLHVESLQNIMWPQVIPNSFNAPIYEFLALPLKTSTIQAPNILLDVKKTGSLTGLYKLARCVVHSLKKI